MEVNGLKEEFEQVVYKNAASALPDANSYVQRSSRGTVRVGESIEDWDAINRYEFKQWQINTELSDADMFDIVNNNFIPELNIVSEVD